jgi:hypothetical protein
MAFESAVCRGASGDPRRRLTLSILLFFCIGREIDDDGPGVWDGPGDCSDGWAGIYQDRKRVIKVEMMKI